MSKNNKGGFTLIELMVVISIIALLSSVVLASLQSAKKRSNDATVRQELLQVRSWMELQRDTNGSYANAFGATALGSAVQTTDGVNGVNYFAFGPTSGVSGGVTTNLCSTINDTQLKNVCTDIVKNSANATIPVLLIGGPQTTWATHNQYSIQAQVPSTVQSNQLSTCLGSSNNTSSNNDDLGSGSYLFSGTGCLANP